MYEPQEIEEKLSRKGEKYYRFGLPVYLDPNGEPKLLKGWLYFTGKEGSIHPPSIGVGGRFYPLLEIDEEEELELVRVIKEMVG